MKKLNKYKSWKGYKNAEDILPCIGDGISMHDITSDLGFYVQGINYSHDVSEPPMRIQPHHKFEPVDCGEFSVISFGVRCYWDCDTDKIPSPNRVVIIYSKDKKESYEIPAKFVDWSKVQLWKPTFLMVGDE